MVQTKNYDEKVVYCICPKCKSIRKKINRKFNIIKHGKERNGIARFLCRKCGTWFNERTGDAMSWYKR